MQEESPRPPFPDPSSARRPNDLHRLRVARQSRGMGHHIPKIFKQERVPSTSAQSARWRPVVDAGTEKVNTRRGLEDLHPPAATSTTANSGSTYGCLRPFELRRILQQQLWRRIASRAVRWPWIHAAARRNGSANRGARWPLHHFQLRRHFKAH